MVDEWSIPNMLILAKREDEKKKEQAKAMKRLL